MLVLFLLGVSATVFVIRSSHLRIPYSPEYCITLRWRLDFFFRFVYRNGQGKWLDDAGLVVQPRHFRTPRGTDTTKPHLIGPQHVPGGPRSPPDCFVLQIRVASAICDPRRLRLVPKHNSPASELVALVNAGSAINLPFEGNLDERHLRLLL